MNVLVVDIGGSHVKLFVTGRCDPERFDSGSSLTPDDMMARIRKLTADWRYDVVSLGFPGPVDTKGPAKEPGNLGSGWVGHDFEAAFGRPVRVINDAAMQAMGAYSGGRMLFLGLGTGVGSTLVADGAVVSLELGCLLLASGKTMFDVLGKEALERDGKENWMAALNQALGIVQQATEADYIVLGGGNAGEVDPLPPNVRRGGNQDAFTGGLRLWEPSVEFPKKKMAASWRIIF